MSVFRGERDLRISLRSPAVTRIRVPRGECSPANQQRSCVPVLRFLLVYFLMRRCRHCGDSEIVSRRTGRARYCKPLCRLRMHRLLEVLSGFPPCIEELRGVLHSYAPPKARGYRLFWLTHEGEVGFPRDDGGAWVCSTGRKSTARSFRLYPFEAPMVPHAGLYGVGYIGQRQVDLPPVEALLPGVYVEPIKIQGKP